MADERKKEIPAPGYYGNPQSDFEAAEPKAKARPPGQSIDSEVEENPKKLPSHPDFNKAAKFCCFIEEAVLQSKTAAPGSKYHVKYDWIDPKLHAPKIWPQSKKEQEGVRNRINPIAKSRSVAPNTYDH